MSNFKEDSLNARKSPSLEQTLRQRREQEDLSKKLELINAMKQRRQDIPYDFPKLLGPILCSQTNLISNSNDSLKKEPKMHNTMGQWSLYNALFLDSSEEKSPRIDDHSDDESDEEPSMIVIHFGSYVTRAGFSGDDAPKVIQPSVWCKTEEGEILYGTDLRKLFAFSSQAEARAGAASQSKPMVSTSSETVQPQVSSEHEQEKEPLKKEPLVRPLFTAQHVLNREKMTGFLFHIFQKLGVDDTTKHSVILTLPSSTARETKTLMTELLFERFAIPSLGIQHGYDGRIYSFGSTTSLNIHLGQSAVKITSIYNSVLLGSRSYLPLSGHNLTLEAIRQCKLVTGDRQECDMHPNCAGALREWERKYDKTCKPSSVVRTKRKQCNSNNNLYMDKSLVYQNAGWSFGSQGFKAFVDADQSKSTTRASHTLNALLFPRQVWDNNELKGLAELVAEVISDVPIDCRFDLLDNLIITGGGACYPGLQEALSAELNKLIPRPGRKGCSFTPTPQLDTWIGLSVWANVSRNLNLLINPYKYE